MNRRQILIFDEKTGKPITKDYLTYNITFHGKDWLGNDLSPVGHFEGKSIKPKIRVTIEKNWETGDGIEKKVYDDSKDEYYIELTDKNSLHFSSC